MSRPWEILGVHPDASESSIKSAYRRLARNCHPDAGGSAEEFTKLQEAYKAMLEGNPRGDPKGYPKGNPHPRIVFQNMFTVTMME